jgi:hypothetical protein
MQLSGLFPGNYYNSDESKALDFMGYFAHQRQQDEAFKNQELNRQKALQDIFHDEQMNPLKVQQQQGLLDRQSAELPGIRANSRKQELDTDFAEQLHPEKIKRALAESMAGLSEAEMKTEMLSVTRMLQNPHIHPQARKVLEMVRDNFPENYRLNKTLEGKEDVATIGANARGRASGTGGPKAPADRFAIISKITNPFDKFTALKAYAAELDDGHPDKAKAEAAAEAIKAEAQTAADTRVPNKFEKGPDGQWRPVKAPELTSPATAPKPSTAKPASLGEVQKMYPGVPADKLKEAYKRKFGVDLK